MPQDPWSHLFDTPAPAAPPPMAAPPTTPRAPLATSRSNPWDTYFDQPADQAITPAGGSFNLWDSLKTYLGEATASINPVNIALGLRDLAFPDKAAQTAAGQSFVERIMGTRAQTPDGKETLVPSKWMQEWERGNKLGAIRELATAVTPGVPLVGPRLQQAVDAFDAGEISKGMGILTDLGIANVGLPMAARAIPKGTGTVTIPPVARNRNPADLAAIATAEAEGVRLPASVQTGNPFIRNVQKIAEHSSMLGAAEAMARHADETADMASWGQRIMRKVDDAPPRTLEQIGTGIQAHAQAGAAAEAAARTATGQAIADATGFGTYESAGKLRRVGLESRIDLAKGAADTAYGTLRKILSDKKAEVRVQTGTRQVKNGNVVVREEPVFESIQAPVNMQPVQQVLAPIREALIAEREAGGGLIGSRAEALALINKVVDGPQFAPAAAVDGMLSGLKEIARKADSPALRNATQGIAAKTIQRLDADLRSAVGKAGGQEALAALMEGRQLTKTRWRLGEVLDKLHDEPVRTARGVLQSGDAAIEALRNVHRTTPEVIPELRSAYVRDLMAMDDAGNRAKALSDWTAKGRETKNLLFQGEGGPSLRRAVETFLTEDPTAPGTMHDTLARLRSEPVTILTEATLAGDKGIGRLRDLARLRPDDMAATGRALIEGIFDKAEAGGDFARTGASANTWWSKLGPETKKVLYKDPAHIRELDHFFHIWQRMAENPNPSGSAFVVGAMSHLASGLFEPFSFMGHEIAGREIVRLLHNPKTARALSRGMTLKVGSGAEAAKAAAEIARALSYVRGSGFSPMTSRDEE